MYAGAPHNDRQPLKIVIVNPVWHEADSTPDDVLRRFSTLTGWAGAVHREGADVVVVQRFHRRATTERDGVTYEFIPDGAPARPSTFYGGSALMDQVIAAAGPSVVHVNGMDYPRAIRRIRRSIGHTALAVQDHGGFDPGALSPLRRRWMRRGLASADVLLAATLPQAEAFRASGVVPARTAIRDVMEGSTHLRASGERANRTGELSILWVGRLNANKDPLTVLDGFARFAEFRPARLTFIYSAADLEPQLRDAVARMGDVGARVTLAGAVAHDSLAPIYSAADLFVLGSHREGSGYAALEALACGVVPVLTDIPSFRSLTDLGRLGALWEPGNAASLACALERVAAQPLDPLRDACRTYFDTYFSWNAIGRRAAAVYREFSAP